jgi:tight adherence protein C
MEYLILGVFVFATLAMLAVGLIKTQSESQVKARVSSLQTSAPGALTGRAKKLDDSFTQRVIIPFAQALSDKIQTLIPLSGKSWIRQKLTQAGYTKPQYIKTFMGVHAITTFGAVFFVLFLMLVSHSVSGIVAVMLLICFGGMGFALPLLWLIQQAQKRQDSIRKALPDFLDLLVICVEAGLGLDIAVSKISKTDSIQTSEYLREELVRYTKDIGFGKPRKEALLDLASRTGVDDLNAIVNALVQSYEMGTGVVQSLKVQSEGLRQKRLHRAEAAANKISVKMVLPIYMFFFPGIFIVILGPMVLYAIKQITATMSHTGKP